MRRRSNAAAPPKKRKMKDGAYLILSFIYFFQGSEFLHFRVYF